MSESGDGFWRGVIDAITKGIFEVSLLRAFGNAFLILFLITGVLFALDMAEIISPPNVIRPGAIPANAILFDIGGDDDISALLVLAFGGGVAIFMVAWLPIAFLSKSKSKVRVFKSQDDLFKHLARQCKKIGRRRGKTLTEVRATHVWNEIDLNENRAGFEYFKTQAELLTRSQPKITLQRLLRLPADPQKRRSALEFAQKLLEGTGDLPGLENNRLFKLGLIDELVDRRAYLDVLIVGDSDMYSLIRSPSGGDNVEYCQISNSAYVDLCRKYFNAIFEESVTATPQYIEAELRKLSNPDGQELTERLYEEVWNKSNLGEADVILSSNFILHPNQARGIDGYKVFVEKMHLAFGPHFVIEETVVTQNWTVCRWIARGTHKGEYLGIPATYKAVSVRGLTIFKIAGGKIVEAWTNWDELGLMEQLGAIKLPERIT